MRSPARLCFAVALAATVVSRAAPASADDPVRTPEQLLAAGTAELKAGHLDKACKLLETAYRSAQNLEALYQLGTCEEARDNVATAAAHYDDYLTRFDALSSAEKNREVKRAQEVSGRRAKIEPDIPTVRLVLPASAPDGTRVTRIPRDGGEPIELAVGVPLPIDPGMHVISTEAPGGVRWQGRLVINKGERNKPFVLQVLPGSAAGRASRYGAPVSPVASSLPPLDPGVSAWRVSAYTIGGIGIAGLLVGFIAGGVTWAKKGAVDANCTPPPMNSNPTPRYCNDAGASAADTAHVAGLVSTVGFIAGGVLTVLGVTLFFTEPAPPKLGLGAPAVRVGSIAPGANGLGVVWTW